MQLVSKITIATFDFKIHLTVNKLLHVAECNIGNIFLVYHILLLFQPPKGSWNKLQNMSNSENISHIKLGTQR